MRAALVMLHCIFPGCSRQLGMTKPYMGDGFPKCNISLPFKVNKGLREFTPMLRISICAVIALLSCLAGCGPNEPRAKSVLALQGDGSRGRVLYEQSCAQCHQETKYWPVVVRLYGSTGVVSTVIDGIPNKMPSFASWTNQQLADLHAYLQTSTR